MANLDKAFIVEGKQPPHHIFTLKNPANEWRAAIFSTISLKLITTHLVYILFTAHIVFKETQVLHSE